VVYWYQSCKILEGKTLANDYHWRSTKAKKQLRDRFGRWISLGANVRFRGDGKEQSGTVTSVIDGKAYVDQKNDDGTVTQKIVSPSAIRVIASKATLPPDGKKIRDEKNNFADAIQSADFKSALDETGSAVIERADGYALAANMVDEAYGMDGEAIDLDEATEDKPNGNPIAYQLFAPGGRSLGQYTEAAEGDFDAMVEDDKATNAPDGGDAEEVNTDPSGSGEEAPAAAPAAVAASVEVVGEERPFRVPEAVKSEIQATIASLSVALPEAELAVANRLANDSTVSLSDVEWVHGFFAENDISERLRGGFKGRKWASKIIVATGSNFEGTDVVDVEVDGHPKYQFDDETYGYFAIGEAPGSTICTKLLAVDYETGSVFSWTADGFVLVEGLDMTEVDEPQIIPIDEMSADEFAHWLDSGTSEDFDILDTNPEERNLFTLADSEIDYDELDKAYSIIAAAGDGIYTPIERSQNATKQGRGAGGKFGSTPDAKESVAPQEEAKKVQKARLPVALPLVTDPAARIAEWLATAAEAPVVAAGEPVAAPAAGEAAPEYTEEDQAIEDAATGPTNEALYFAIVDEIDQTAVLDAVAIVKSNGTPSAFIRAQGAWAASPDTLTLLQGSTPPAVVELPDPATVKTVLEQIDAHDAESAPAEAAPAPVAEQPIAASGFALPGGGYTIIDSVDLQEAVLASGADPDIFVKAHIRKRARALNRMDLVPAAWREFSLAEIGELAASQTVYGEYGEIIVASGVPGVADTPTDLKNVAKLQAYWTQGKGALKIRWGTKGDLTRAHRHLSKYVGPQRAWGLAQKYHKSLFGVYNHTHDVATGQYVPRRRKK
jgi:hypothetical protein